MRFTANAIGHACLAAVFAVSSAIGDPLPPADRLQFADGLFSRGLYELAADEYSKLIEEHPDYKSIDAAHYRLGDCYRNLKDQKNAERQYARVFKDYPESAYSVKAGVKRADIFVQAKRYEAGVELYEKVLKKKPDPSVASACHYFIGDAFLALGRTNDAEKAYAAVVKRYSSSDYQPFALLRLADIAGASGKSPESILVFYRSAATNNISGRAAAEALYHIGRLEFGLKHYDESTRAFADLEKRFPEDQRTKDSRLEAAWAQYNSGLTAKALVMAGKQAELAKNDKEKADWLYLKANAERKLKKYEAAVGTYSALIALNQELKSIHIYERALCHFAQGDYDSVVDDLDGLRIKASYEQDRLWLLARSSEGAKHLDASVQYYSKILSQYAEGKFAEESMFRLAGILYDRKDWKSAAEQYGKLVSTFKKAELRPKALFAEGACYLNAGEVEKAVKAWQSLCDEYPKHALAAEALLSGAVAEIQLRRTKDAARTIDRFLASFPGHAKSGEAWFWKGVIASDEKRYKEAERAFNNALERSVEGELNEKARAYRAVAIYKDGDMKRAADELQRLDGKGETEHAGRNLFVWLVDYRLSNNEPGKAADAACKLRELSDLPIEKQEAECLLGRALNEGKKKDKAKTAFMAAYEIDEDSLYKAEAGLALGRMAIAGGQNVEAEKYLSAAASMAEGSDGIAVRARAYMSLGEVAEAKGDNEKAARYFMSVAILFDHEEIVPQALAAAARAYASAGMDKERAQAVAELKERYPKSRFASEGSK